MESFEIIGYTVIKKPVDLARRSRKTDGTLAVRFNGKSGRRAGIIMKYRRSLRNISLFLVILGHFAPSLLKMLHQQAVAFLIKEKLTAKNLRYCFLRQIVLRGSEAAGQNDKIRILQRVNEQPFQAVRIISYDMMIHDIESAVIQLLRKIACVRIYRLAEEKLRPDGENRYIH